MFDLKLRRTRNVGRVQVDCVPPEEMRVSPQARHGLDESPFTQHMRTMSRTDAKELGFDGDLVDSITVARPEWLDLISLARNEVTDQLSEENPTDPASQMIDVRTNYIRVDYDGDGFAEFRRVVVGGEAQGALPFERLLEHPPLAQCVPVHEDDVASAFAAAVRGLGGRVGDGEQHDHAGAQAVGGVLEGDAVLCFALEPAQGPAQLLALLADDVRAKVPVRTGLVAFPAQSLGQVQDGVGVNWSVATGGAEATSPLAR